MYAIVETGGKQVRVSPGEKVRVEKLDVAKGENVMIQKVLLVAKEGGETAIGTPYVEGASVDGKVLRHAKAKKVTVLRYKPKKRVRVKTGHRQDYTLLEIKDIHTGGEEGKKEAAPKKKSSTRAKKEKTQEEETAG